MPRRTISGLKIVYHIYGDRGPWLALTTGGRRGHEEFISLAKKVSALGYRVLLHDRRNTGASDILIDGAIGEESIWVQDLFALLAEENALPAFIGGASSGARVSLLAGLSRPADILGLALIRITGGEFAAKRLPENYYSQFIRAAKAGGMEAVCATEQYKERIAANPENRARLMSMSPARYIEVMSFWREEFLRMANHPVMGASDADLRSLQLPTIIIPGNDKVHSSASGRAAHRLIRGSELHELPIRDQDIPLIPFEEWAPYEDEIALTLASFMNRVGSKKSSSTRQS
jgi:pimeloyl-ACP methyl ester carboxylesterase